MEVIGMEMEVGPQHIGNGLGTRNLENVELVGNSERDFKLERNQEGNATKNSDLERDKVLGLGLGNLECDLLGTCIVNATWTKLVSGTQQRIWNATQNLHWERDFDRTRIGNGTKKGDPDPPTSNTKREHSTTQPKATSGIRIDRAHRGH
jgi:hypothetical protein